MLAILEKHILSVGCRRWSRPLPALEDEEHPALCWPAEEAVAVGAPLPVVDGELGAEPESEPQQKKPRITVSLDVPKSSPGPRGQGLEIPSADSTAAASPGCSLPASSAFYFPLKKARVSKL